MPTNREELLKKARRKMLLEKARAKMKTEQVNQNMPSAAGSAIAGAAQGASLGFVDELAGGFEALGRKAGVAGLGEGFDDWRMATPAEREEKLSTIYERAKQNRRAADQRAQEAHPGMYAGGEIAGSMALPGTSMKALVGQGAAYGVGASEQEDLAGIGKDALTGGTLGAAGGVVAKGAQALGKYAPALGKKAEREAVKALGGTGPQLTKAGLEAGSEQADKVGRQLLDEGVISPLASKTDMYGRTQDAAEKVNDVLDNLYAKSTETTTVREVADALIGGAQDLATDPNTIDQARFIVDYVKKNLLKAKNLDDIYDAADLRELRKGIAKKTKFDKAQTADVQLGRQELVRGVRDVETDTLQLADNAPLEKARAEYSQLAKVRDKVLEPQASRERAKSWSGLGANLATAGFAFGGEPATATAIKGIELWTKHGAKFKAVGFDKTSKVLKNQKFRNILAKAAERGTKAVQASHFLMLQQDPQYREMFHSSEQKEQE